jgi:hypothetical protein
MTGFLINSKQGTSEWIYDFVGVQEGMNELEKIGTVQHVTVQYFKEGSMKQEFTYNYDGQDWVKA